MILKFNNFLNEEVGLRNISKLSALHTTAEIYFHKDLDGVTSAIAMKEFLKNYYQITTVDCHVIQYGGMEYAIAHHTEGNLVILVDFAHGKPMFHIQSDHHDKQVGSSDTQTTYFKQTRSNAEIISGEISYSDIFMPQDIELIRTVDSANFVEYNITPEDVQNAIFHYKKSESAAKNRFMMGFVVNRLLLSYKNKRITVPSMDGKRKHDSKNILECIVLDSTGSLYSIFNNLRYYINEAVTGDKLGTLADPEDITLNLGDYIERMKHYRFIEDPNSGEKVEFDPKNAKHVKIATQGSKISSGVHFDEKYKIISQYGGGNLYKPGSYDRYVPFKNFPDADYICMVWPMGLLQVSCNPFKTRKRINLGEISKEVLAKHESVLKRFYIPLGSLKREFETSQDWQSMHKWEGDDFESVGFRFNELNAFYSDCVYKKEGSEIVKVNIETEPNLKETMNEPYDKWDAEDQDFFGKLKIPAWEIIVRNSGGHPTITNIAGLNLLKLNPTALKIAYNTEKYVDVLKMLGRDFINNLKEKIDEDTAGKELKYDTKGVELLGQESDV